MSRASLKGAWRESVRTLQRLKPFLEIYWEDEGERETVLEILKAECEVLAGKPEAH